MEMETIKITDLKPAEYNPRRISDEDYQKLKNSISTFGLVDPIIVNLKNMHIVGGHQRYDVLLEEHMLDNDFLAELPMIRLGDVGFVFTDTNLSIADDDHEKALNLALNKISGEWDEQKLQPLLEELELSPIDIQLTGFSEPELEELNIDTTEETGECVVEDDYVEPEELETDIKHGDLFRLGNHYLCCGDATIEEDVERLLSASGEREY
ncbi:ParB N-terminal domain-containing protein [uncultured Methanobrevibacter sp.]|uniref:ParB N-terminal domain-containing protein n=1 Tax=uncultured Methanobrevibacter sp. TaxID=253161 RepID=UPI0025D52039|nr:ParB N-terminal domain-containing protein [uncultured Methanobrevibacter sp.]